MRIAVDIDGVLADFNFSAKKMLNSLGYGPYNLDEEPAEWDWVKGKEAKALWHGIENYRNWWQTLKPYHDNVRALIRFILEAQGKHDVYLVTSRVSTEGDTVAKQTRDWLDLVGYGFPAHSYLGIIQTEGSKFKRDIYKSMNIIASVDDYAPTILECDGDPLSDGSGFHEAYLLNRPWNLGIKVSKRVENLQQFFDALKPKLGL